MFFVCYNVQCKNCIMTCIVFACNVGFKAVAHGHWGHHLGAIKEGLHTKANVVMFIQM